MQPKEIGEKVSAKRRFDVRDHRVIAEFVCDEWKRRKQGRRDIEKQWKEIDRQLRMDPDVSYKLDPNGAVDRKKAWMPEMELPLQSQSLEMLCADSRRLKFPSNGLYFQCHAALTDDYLDRVDMESLIEGDRNEVPSLIDQDNANKIAEGVTAHWNRQANVRNAYDQIDAEAFKYGTGVGRMRMAAKRVFAKTTRGVVKEEQAIPVLIPSSIWRTYLDDSCHAMMLEGQFVSPSYIVEKRQRVEDMRLAANKGSNEPEDPNGGWMPAAANKLDGDESGHVTLIEYEGDLVVPRKTTRAMYVPNAIVTVAVGKRGRDTHQEVIRFRFNAYPFPTFIESPYHVEDLSSPYATSPLMKGMPIQKAATDALNRLLMAAALNVTPPLGYDRSDMEFAQNGGPVIAPGAQWGTVGEVKEYSIGDPQAMFVVYAGLLQQYADVTGINAPRLGAQTNSHTTAFAKDTEVTRGLIRTVDYVRACLDGPMSIHLDRQYKMARDKFRKSSIMIESYGGFVSLEKKHLPDHVVYEVHGAGGPAEEQAIQQSRLQAATLALQIDQVGIQLGEQPVIDRQKMIRQLLREGKWTDVDAILRSDAVSSVAPVGPEMAGGGALPGVLATGIPEVA